MKDNATNKNTAKVNLESGFHYMMLFGYVPKGWDDRIECGAYKNSPRINFVDDTLNAYDFAGNLLVECKSFEDFWDPKSAFWAELSAYLTKKMSAPRPIDPERLANFWATYQDEAEPVDGVMRADSEYGEIADGGQYADSFFAYVQAVEDGDPEEEGTIFIIR